MTFLVDVKMKSEGWKENELQSNCGQLWRADKRNERV